MWTKEHQDKMWQYFVENCPERFEEYYKARRAAERAEKKYQIEVAQAIKADMTVEEKINFVNTPYKDMPPELQPGMTKWPQVFNYMRMKHPHIGMQQETLAARLIRFRDDHDMDEDTFINLCNLYAKKFDLDAQNGRKRQRTRITHRDLTNYEDFNVCPKIDKLVAMCRAMGVSEAYFTGYKYGNPPGRGAISAFGGSPSNKESIRSRYRKHRQKAA